MPQPATTVGFAVPGGGAGPVAAVAPSGIVTPEAVLLQFETAGIATRVLARIIDSFVTVVVLSLVLGVLASAFGSIGDHDVVGIVAGFAVVFAYPALAEWLSDGRTIGKSAVGLRVVTQEGGPVRFRHAAIRSALQLVDLFLSAGAVAIVSALAGRTDQRLGDRLAGTIVLRVASATPDARAIAFPPLPGYEGYVAALDVGGVTPEQYEVLRSFLTRVRELSPAARAELALGLARPLAASMGHTPPAQVHPEHFLASVAAAYQLRHGGPAGFGAWTPPMRP